MGKPFYRDAMSTENPCSCNELDDLAIVGMGDPEGLDEQLLTTLKVVKWHGGRQWWLNASSCSACGQAWMIAQDERIHDNYCLKRISPESLHQIVQKSLWPSDFLKYEQVLRLERQSGRIAQFIDAQSPALVATVEDLRAENPDISIQDIAYVLAISTDAVTRLL